MAQTAPKIRIIKKNLCQTSYHWNTWNDNSVLDIGWLAIDNIVKAIKINITVTPIKGITSLLAISCLRWRAHRPNKKHRTPKTDRKNMLYFFLFSIVQLTIEKNINSYNTLRYFVWICNLLKIEDLFYHTGSFLGRIIQSRFFTGIYRFNIVVIIYISEKYEIQKIFCLNFHYRKLYYITMSFQTIFENVNGKLKTTNFNNRIPWRSTYPSSESEADPGIGI